MAEGAVTPDARGEPAEPEERTGVSSSSASKGSDGNQSKPYRILHISDVHFGSHFDISAWEYVVELAKREKPDLIACTGDVVDHGGLFMLAAAWLQLEELRKSVGENVLLRCVPGNHDCGPFGNVNVRPFSTNFAALFGPHAMSVPSCMPSFLGYRRRLWPVRLAIRWCLTPWLYGKKWVTAIDRWWNDKSLKEIPILRDGDPAQVVLVYLDSNYTPWLATGNVDPKEVTLLQAKMLNLRDQEGARPFVPRIALVHHHPLPIPEASIREGLTSFEPFLVLRNSGLVLKELNRCDVDLILHGHKHYSAFGRLGYSVDHRVEGEIAVLAAGSCGITHAESGRNSVNIIDVLETGRMAYTPVYFGGGGAAPLNQLLDGKREVHDLEMHKARVHRRASERQSQWVKQITHAVAIDAGGVALVRHDVVGHMFDRPQKSDDIPVCIEVSMGRVTHTTLELSELSKRAGHTWIDLPTAPKRKVRCGLRLGPRLANGVPADYGYQYVCFNTYATTEWESVTACARETRLGRPGRVAGVEITSFIVRVPTQTLVLRVQLPAGPMRAEPFVQVMRWSRYPATKLDAAGQFQEDVDGQWVYDTDLTVHEAGRLNQIGNHVWELRIDNPMVAHRYDVRWRVKHPSTSAFSREETECRGRAAAYRDDLLGLAIQRPLQGYMSIWAQELREKMLLPYFKAHVPREADLELALFVYDENEQVLRQVMMWPTTEKSICPEKALEIPLGEGVVGAAFKRSEFVIYINPALTGSKEDAAYLYQDIDDDEWCDPEWKFVLAVPIFAFKDVASLHELTFDGWGPQATVGVLTIASKASDSGLLRLTSPGQEPPLVEGGATQADEPITAEAAQRGTQSTAEASTDAGDATGGNADSVQPQVERPPNPLEIWGAAHVFLDFLPVCAEPEAPREGR